LFLLQKVFYKKFAEIRKYCSYVKLYIIIYKQCFYYYILLLLCILYTIIFLVSNNNYTKKGVYEYIRINFVYIYIYIYIFIYSYIKNFSPARIHITKLTKIHYRHFNGNSYLTCRVFTSFKLSLISMQHAFADQHFKIYEEIEN